MARRVVINGFVVPAIQQIAIMTDRRGDIITPGKRDQFAKMLRVPKYQISGMVCTQTCTRGQWQMNWNLSDG